MAAAGVAEDASSFVAAHSELFKEQKAGDADATVEGCFPPMMPAERVTQCLVALAGLSDECSPPAATTPHPHRIFWVRDSALHASLEGFDNEEGLADLRTVLDYMLLPKALNKALELEAAVLKARHDFQAAIGGYNLVTATSPKPRLIEFLVEDERLLERLKGALKVLPNRLHVWGLSIDPAHGLLPGRGFDADGMHDSDRTLHLGWLDGLMGESLSEYGYTPSKHRLLAYASGCIFARRAIPPTAVLTLQAVDGLGMKYSSFLPIITARPLYLAACLGDLAALQQFYSLSENLSEMQRFLDLAPLAAQANCRETMTWLRSLDPKAFDAHKSTIWYYAASEGNFELLRWMDAEWGLRLAPGENDNRALHAIKAAAEHNDLSALKWLHVDLGLPLRPEVGSWACRHGNREMLEWYFSREGAVKWNWHTFWEGLHGGQWELTLALFDVAPPTEDPFAVPDHVLRCGLEYACEGTEGNTRALDAIMAVRSRLPPPYPDTRVFGDLAEVAARLGHVHALEWITKQPGGANYFRQPLDRLFCHSLEFAVLGGHVECVRFLVGQATEALIAYASAHTAPSTRRSPIVYAWKSFRAGIRIERDLVEVLAPYYNLSCFYGAAIAARDVNLARQLKAMGVQLVESDRSTQRALIRLLETGHWTGSTSENLLELLAIPGDQWSMATSPLWTNSHALSAARGGSVAMLQFLSEHGVSLDSAVLLEAAGSAQLPLCRWLRQQGVHWPANIVKHARAEGADEVAAWIEQEQAKEKAGAAGSAAGHAGAGEA